jgi:hypothetical protein
VTPNGPVWPLKRKMLADQWHDLAYFGTILKDVSGTV